MRYLLFVSFFIVLSSCKKIADVPPVGSLIGNWKSITGDDVVKLKIDQYARIKLMTSTDRGFKFRADGAYVDYNVMGPSSDWKHVVFEKKSSYYLKINVKVPYDTIWVYSYKTVNDFYCCGQVDLLMV